MKHKKIRDPDKIRQTLRSNVVELHNFAINHHLDNIEIRTEKVIKKIDSGCEINKLFLNKLKDDLFADILGPEYYWHLDLSYIPYSPSPAFKIALSIKKIDDHIFGDSLRRKDPQKPFSLAIPKEYNSIMGRAQKTVFNDLEEIKNYITVGDYSYPIVSLTLSAFRNMHDTIIEANKQFVKSIDKKLFGKFNEEFWEEFLSYEHQFEKQPDKNGNVKYVSDFNVIGGSASHARVINNKNGTVTIIPDPDEYVNTRFDYTNQELVVILFSQCRKLIDYLPALILVEKVVNYRSMYELIDT